MSDTTPERTMPEAIEEAMGQVIMICVDHGNGVRPSSECQRAVMSFRQAILAALEPDRELRERAERLRVCLLTMKDDSEIFTERALVACDRKTMLAMQAIQPGDLANDLLTATSSSQEVREGVE